MISRQTIFSLLITLLLVGGIGAWSLGHRDECSAYLAGVPRAPAEMVVTTGDHRLMVPCTHWFARQPPLVQTLCLGVAAGAVVFAVSVAADRSRRGGG